MGAGLSQIDEIYPDSANNKIGVTWKDWTPVDNSSIKDWGVTWEFLAGYKHWLNDWVGFRYYANVGAQHYKHEIFTSGNVKAGIIEYTANADLLLNFYTSEFWSFGILGGFGVGGAYFDSPALDNYRKRWSKESPNFSNERYKNIGQTKNHHLSASLSAGMRFNFFQKIRKVAQKTCGDVENGRRTCRVPISYLEHSVEFNAKFPMLTYHPTDPGDVIGAYCTDKDANLTGQYKCLWKRPGYEVKNPYKLTLRYIFAF
ncbi:outer membrane beta-barrel protein [Helicobacter sp. 23-1044]